MQQINSSRSLFGPDPDWPFRLLSALEPGLILDVGGAAGILSLKMAQASPQSRILAYEPFPGNWSHFDRSCGDNSNITLVKKAASDFSGECSFAVPGTVSGSEAGWEKMLGYSSLGYLTETKDDNTVTVQTARIDDEVSERVTFMKIDVQGGEDKVIRGCEALIKKGLIDVLYVEFDGRDKSAAEFLMKKGFTCFDSGYCAIPWRPDGQPMGGFEIIEPLNLSTGAQAWCFWPTEFPRTIGAYAGWLCDLGYSIGYAWTDLVFVRPGFERDFFSAATSLFKVR